MAEPFAHPVEVHPEHQRQSPRVGDRAAAQGHRTGRPFLCGHDCPHVGAGVTADQLRRFLDSLDARAAYCREEVCAASFGDHRDDREEEAEIAGDCRRYLQEATGLKFPPSSPPAAWPLPRPRYTHAQVSCDAGRTWHEWTTLVGKEW